MTISELIQKLQEIEDKHGDVYVEIGTGHLAQSVVEMRADETREVVAARIA